MAKKRYTVDELLRLACIYAERDRLEYIDSVSHCEDGEKEEAERFLNELRAYRMKRWGKTKLEAALSQMKPVCVTDLANKLEG